MFRCLAQGIHGLLDLVSFLLCCRCNLGFCIVLLWTSFASGDSDGLSSLLCSSPGGNTYLVKRFGRPLHNVERINAAFCIREILLYTICDPSGAIAGHHFNGCTLPRSKLFAELLQNRFAVILCCPDNRIGLVVYNDCDIAVPLTVAGLVDSNLYNSVKTDVDIGFEIFMDARDTSADSTPVDPHIFGDGTAAEVLSHPGDGIIEVFRKARVRKCPWYISGLDSVFFAANAWNACFNINKDPAKIQRTPTFMLIRSIIDPGVPLTAYRASPLKPLAQMHFDQNT